MVKQIKDKEDNVVAELLQEDDIQTEVEGTVAVIGYASQGAAQSKCFRDTGITTILGLRRSGESWKRAEEDGWVERQTLFEIQDAV